MYVWYVMAMMQVNGKAQNLTRDTSKTRWAIFTEISMRDYIMDANRHAKSFYYSANKLIFMITFGARHKAELTRAQRHSSISVQTKNVVADMIKMCVKFGKQDLKLSTNIN